IGAVVEQDAVAAPKLAVGEMRNPGPLAKRRSVPGGIGSVSEHGSFPPRTCGTRIWTPLALICRKGGTLTCGCRDPDSGKHGHDAENEVPSDRLVQEQRADRRRRDRIDGDRDGYARRRRALQRESPEIEGQRSTERAEIERGPPLCRAERHHRRKAAAPPGERNEACGAD